MMAVTVTVTVMVSVVVAGAEKGWWWVSWRTGG